MSRKSLCLVVAVVVVGTIFLSAYLASAAPPGKGSDRVLSKIRFIHFKKGHAKPPWAGPPNGGGKEDEKGYYSYIAKGAKWEVIEDYLLNPGNNDGVGQDLVLYAVAAGMNEWEAYGGEIFRDLKLDNGVSYKDGAYRGWNTLSFGSYGNPDVIAVATVWGYFTGPPSQREIVEAHVLMNDDFVWGDAAGDVTLMDIQNIVTHEIGHCAGMGDVYQLEASEETMYGYSEEGETIKRDLYYGDITGITKLYK